ncbi:MAG: hypothetical protein WDN24_01650 [Sphingomonas sp.]
MRNLGRLATSGNDAVGISAISVGGSGGYGGGAGGVIAIGGSGGGGSDGGTVTIVQGGTIATTGDGSHGVFASSIGGDGGVANSANGVFAFGARGGGDGILLCKLSRGGDYCNNGGAVTVTNRGSITTGGDLALGILAQSLGGGGGAAGSQTGWLAIGGFGGEGRRRRRGQGAERSWPAPSGLRGTRPPQSWRRASAAAGGFAGNANGIAIGVSLEIGGDGGNGGNGGRVDIVNDAALATSGYESPMILAQSIGGGGGNGGDATAEGVSVVNITVGGSGSAGGDGNRVTVINRGALAGALDRSSGIVAQSIGRGGGTGGSGYNATVFPLVDIGIAVGGSGDGGGTGGAVIVEEFGRDHRRRRRQPRDLRAERGRWRRHGRIGRRLCADRRTQDRVRSGGRGRRVGRQGSSGSTVTVTNGGQLHTYGDSGHGIQAQSVGGGGGVGGDASASATAITVTGSSIALTVAWEVPAAPVATAARSMS